MGNNQRSGIGIDVKIRSDNHTRSIVNSDIPFCMAVLGDFSGRHDLSADNQKSLRQRKPTTIDRDNFDQVLKDFSLTLTLSAGENISIAIGDLDDFHPDVLYEKLDVFSKLRSIRRRLQDNASFDSAASEIMGWLVDEDKHKETKPEPQKFDQVADLSSEHLLEDVLDSTKQSSSDIESLVQPGGIDRLVKDIIAPYVEPSANPRQQEMVDAVDKAIAGHMRQILHHPHFQRVEAAWRSLYFLVSCIETGSDLKIYLLDVSKQELEQDMGGDVDSSELHKLFCEPAVNDTPWSLMVGNYQFEDSIEDVLLLSQLGQVAKKAGAVFLSGAKETLAGCESLARFPDVDDWQYQVKPGVENAWNILRQDPVADVIGLALPRFLLRLPYGEKTNPIESFSFEEIKTDDREERHRSLLWGNAAIIKAEQLARSYSANQWNMQPAETSQTDNLPLYYYVDEGETLPMPCAEIYLTEKCGRKMSEKGLITLWSVKNMDAVRSSDFNALSADGKTLQGRWVK